MSLGLAGFAVPYNVEGIPADGSRETIAPGSLKVGTPQYASP
jgi:hypothetical protein